MADWRDLAEGLYAIPDPHDPGAITYWRRKQIKSKRGTRPSFGPWPPKARSGPVLYTRDVPRDLHGQDRSEWVRDWYTTIRAPYDAAVVEVIAADPAAADFVQRAAPYCRRIAALHTALDGRSLTTAGDLQAAAHLIRYSIASARYVLDPSPRDIRLDKLRRAVDEAGMAGLSRADARNVFGGHVTKQDMDNLVELLTTDGSYTQEEIKTEGRPRTVIRAARKGRKAQ